jgi:hypothetical protein
VTGGVWIASYVLLWVAVLVLGTAVIALLRQIGVLHTRLRPLGTHFASEGPERLAPAPAAELFPYGSTALTVLAFTSPTCEICHALEPGLRALDDQYDELRLELVEHGAATLSLFTAFNVTSTPYFVTVDSAGIVQARGVANTLEQIEVMIEESLAPGPERPPERTPGPERAVSDG